MLEEGDELGMIRLGLKMEGKLGKLRRKTGERFVRKLLQIYKCGYVRETINGFLDEAKGGGYKGEKGGREERGERRKRGGWKGRGGEREEEEGWEGEEEGWEGIGGWEEGEEEGGYRRGRRE